MLGAASLCHAGCGLPSCTWCSFFQVTDLQIRPEDNMAPFVLCAGASLLLTHCPQCALSLPAPAALSPCCSCWPQKVSHQLGSGLKLDGSLNDSSWFPVDSVMSCCDLPDLDLIFLSHSVSLRVYSSFALLIASIILLCYLKSTLEELGFFFFP